MTDLEKALLSKPQGASPLSSIAAGGVVWLLTLSLGVGFAAFAFNSAPELVTEGIQMQVFGSAVVYIVSGLGSQSKDLFWQASPIPSLYYGAFVQIAVKSCNGDLTSTIQVFIMVSTALFGIALLLCAKFNAGKILELFPDSVLTGYIGGIGTLIIRSALTLLSGADPLVNIEMFSEQTSLVRVAVGCAIGLVTFILMRNFPHPATMVLPIFATIALFYIGIFTFGLELQTLRDSDWVFQNFGVFAFQNVWTQLKLNSVDFSLIGQSGPALILQMVLLSAVAQYSSGGAVLVEFTGSTAGVDQGTKLLGIGNLIVGGCSGMALAGGMAPSAVASAILGKGNANRWPHIVCGCLHLALFMSGFPLVAYLPKCALAGCLLIPIGMKMMWGALLGSLYSFALGDYMCIVAVSATTIFSDVQTALYVGFVFNSFLMIFNYAQSEIVYERSSLSAFRSLKDRSIEQRSFIEASGKSALVWRLHGVLFLGNSLALKNELTNMLDGACEARFLILDFARVSYVEHSVWALLFQLADKAKKSGSVNLWICALNVDLKRQLAACGSAALKLQLYRSLALALEVAEEEILKEAPSRQALHGDLKDTYRMLSSSLASLAGSSQTKWSSEQFSAFFEEETCSAEKLVCSEGQPSDYLYFVVRGEYHLYTAAASNFNLLRKMIRGSMFGAEALLGMSVYKASVQCKVGGVLIKLSRDGFALMRSRDPQMALDLMMHVAHLRSTLCWELLQFSFSPDNVSSVKERSKSRRFTAVGSENTAVSNLVSQESSYSRIRVTFRSAGGVLLGGPRGSASDESSNESSEDLVKLDNEKKKEMDAEDARKLERRRRYSLS